MLTRCKEREQTLKLPHLVGFSLHRAVAERVDSAVEGVGENGLEGVNKRVLNPNQATPILLPAVGKEVAGTGGEEREKVAAVDRIEPTRAERIEGIWQIRNVRWDRRKTCIYA